MQLLLNNGLFHCGCRPHTVTTSTNSCNSFQGQLHFFSLSLYPSSGVSSSSLAFKVASKNLPEQLHPNQQITSLQRQLPFLVDDVSKIAWKCTIGSSITAIIQISSNFFNQSKDTSNIIVVFSSTFSQSTKKIFRFLWKHFQSQRCFLIRFLMCHIPLNLNW